MNLYDFIGLGSATQFMLSWMPESFRTAYIKAYLGIKR